jgi:UDP-arabinose 4-epimerase
METQKSQGPHPLDRDWNGGWKLQNGKCDNWPLPSAKGHPLQNVLVVGGAGYIGSHTAKYLKGHGFSPVVYDNLSRGNKWAVRWGPLEEGDISDKQVLLRVMLKYRPIAVMHFAAFAYVGESVKDPSAYYRNNVSGTLALLDAMREAGIDKLVFSSTCAVYGVPETLPITEDFPRQPINPYGAGKLMVERILEDYGKAYGLKHASLRYFNAAGADPENEIGESHSPETHLLPLAIEAGLGRGRGLTVFGRDYPTHDGTCIRDYVHVWDLAQAHHLALAYLLGGGSSDCFNLGNESGHSIGQVIEAISRKAGKPLPVVYEGRRPGDPPALVGSAAKAKSVLGWKPAWANLQDIVETAWNWHARKKPGE